MLNVQYVNVRMLCSVILSFKFEKVTVQNFKVFTVQYFIVSIRNLLDSFEFAQSGDAAHGSSQTLVKRNSTTVHQEEEQP